MIARVIDTNVAVVANGHTPQAGPGCVLNCVEALERVVAKGRVVIDAQGLILDQYRRYLSPSGQPGAGDFFFKWLWHHQFNKHDCERVEIHPKGGGTHEFEEFPDDRALDGFHDDERKFVAVALASKYHPAVWNAVDSDWWNFREALHRHGVRIEFLCPEQFEEGG